MIDLDKINIDEIARDPAKAAEVIRALVKEVNRLRVLRRFATMAVDGRPHARYDNKG